MFRERPREVISRVPRFELEAKIKELEIAVAMARSLDEQNKVLLQIIMKLIESNTRR